MIQRGFTIVELLIVIVVIAVLASISVVAYNGIQSRAQLGKVNNELSAINKAILMYHAENGSYPTTGGDWRGYHQTGAHGQNVVPGIVPAYISTMPVPTRVDPTADYLYRSDGTNYKLIAHMYTSLCATAVQQNPSQADPIRNCWGWGYWSPGGSGF